LNRQSSRPQTAGHTIGPMATNGERNDGTQTGFSAPATLVTHSGEAEKRADSLRTPDHVEFVARFICMMASPTGVRDPRAHSARSLMPPRWLAERVAPGENR